VLRQASDEFGKEKPSVFEIRKRVELGKMAELFLGKRGRLFFYFVMIIYLYGDLAIYGGRFADRILITFTYARGVEICFVVVLSQYLCRLRCATTQVPSRLALGTLAIHTTCTWSSS